MKLRKIMYSAVIAAVSVTGSAYAVNAANASAEWQVEGVIGDINGDKDITVADYVLIAKHIINTQPLGNESILNKADTYYSVGTMYGTEFKELVVYDKNESFIQLADLNQDGIVNSADLVLMRRNILSYEARNAVYRWYEETTTTATTTVTAPITTTTTTSVSADFIAPPIYDMYGSMPSQGEAKLAVFYVDFPDSKYNYNASVEEIEKAVFGEENTQDPNYPFDSISAFYNRSSKGALKLDGSVYQYTAQHEKSYYENDVYKGKIASEVIKAFDSKIDYSQFDGDGDKVVDAVLICVPNSEGTGEWNSDWWPAAGSYGGGDDKFDGCKIGHVIVGNSVIESSTDHSYFVSTYLHELGHCMRLPDFYFYTQEDDWQGLHGSAGYTMMDDANCDFCAASKLMLGWYKPEQVQVYDSSAGTQTFTLNNAQSADGNCVIIPCGKLKDNYRSEFFIIEYMTSKNNNNSDVVGWLNWLGSDGKGIRVFHVEASVTDNGWWKYFTYQSGEDENTNFNNGRRFIRLIDDSQKDNLYHTGDVIDSSISGFNWYDSYGNQTIDPNVKITVGETTGDTYTITISNK